MLACCDGRELAEAVEQAAALLATVLGQDLEAGDDGVFRIARRVAKDRVISTVDPDARHGHKTAARGFDGYKGHVAVDPDSEIITATTVTPGNAGDAASPRTSSTTSSTPTADRRPDRGPGRPASTGGRGRDDEVGRSRWSTATTPMAPASSTTGSARPGSSPLQDPDAAAAGGLFSKDRFDINLAR